MDPITFRERLEELIAGYLAMVNYQGELTKLLMLRVLNACTETRRTFAWISRTEFQPERIEGWRS